MNNRTLRMGCESNYILLLSIDTPDTYIVVHITNCPYKSYSIYNILQEKGDTLQEYVYTVLNAYGIFFHPMIPSSLSHVVWTAELFGKLADLLKNFPSMRIIN